MPKAGRSLAAGWMAVLLCLCAGGCGSLQPPAAHAPAAKPERQAASWQSNTSPVSLTINHGVSTQQGQLMTWGADDVSRQIMDLTGVKLVSTTEYQSLEVLQGFIREELADRRTYLFLARRAPTAEVRQVFRAIASDEGRHARRLLAAVYLITGERYCPAICYPPLRCDGYCAALRERYHEEVCAARQYDRAAQSAGDACLSQLFRDLSRDETRHARQLMALLEQNILAF